MVDDGQRFVPYTLTCRQQPTTKLSVLVVARCFGIRRPWTKVGSKETVLFEHLPPKRHVAPVRGMTNFDWLIAEVEEPKEERPLAFDREPGRCCKSLRWKNASS